MISCSTHVISSLHFLIKFCKLPKDSTHSAHHLTRSLVQFQTDKKDYRVAAIIIDPLLLFLLMAEILAKEQLTKTSHDDTSLLKEDYYKEKICF